MKEFLPHRNENFSSDVGTCEHLVENIETSFLPFQMCNSDVIDEAGVDLGFVDDSILDLDLVEKPSARALRVTGRLSRR